jgi:hypothetical protein
MNFTQFCALMANVGALIYNKDDKRVVGLFTLVWVVLGLISWSSQ